jgi:EAL and modified HD-GYP domain-containing signal transduction protein
MNNPIIIRQPVFNNNKKVIAYDISINEELKSDEVIKIQNKNLNDIPKKVNRQLKDKNNSVFKDEIILFPFKSEEILNDNLEDLLFINYMGWIIDNKLEITKNIMEKIKKLKSAGAKFLLENVDCIGEIKKEMIDVLDIIIINIDTQKNNDIQEFIKKTNLKYKNIKFLAKNVNTIKDFKTARHIGFNYYQGLFFQEPNISNTNIPGYQINYLSVLKELNKEDLDFNKLKEIMKKDMSMCKSLLKTINAAYYGQNISSIKKASVMLGIKGLRKWSMIYLIEALKASKPDILFINALIRADFSESLTKIFNVKENLDQYFIMGMFSMLDVFMDTELKIILKEIGIGKNMKKAILYKTGEMGAILKIVEKFDKADAKAINELKEIYPKEFKDIYVGFLEAVEFAYNTFAIMNK